MKFIIRIEFKLMKCIYLCPNTVLYDYIKNNMYQFFNVIVIHIFLLNIHIFYEIKKYYSFFMTLRFIIIIIR